MGLLYQSSNLFKYCWISVWLDMVYFTKKHSCCGQHCSVSDGTCHGVSNICPNPKGKGAFQNSYLFFFSFCFFYKKKKHITKNGIL